LKLSLSIFYRFKPHIEDLDCQLAAVFHPRVCLMWLNTYDPSRVPRVQQAIEAALEEALKMEAGGGRDDRDEDMEALVTGPVDFLACVTQPTRSRRPSSA
jgi:hypothetical protein